MRRTYWRRLKDHPGVPTVVAMTLMAGLIGGRDDWRRGAVGAVVTLVTLGSIVLWSNRSMP